ncbi:MAG: hypothetical protein FWG64_11025 [Firmicutes bacterium]|nr:hypothetical protein [Bacillota bacterium]
MNFTLKTCLGGKTTETVNPSPEKIDYSIGCLLPMESYFAIIETDERLYDCEYMQTLITYHDTTAEIRYLLEICFDNYEKRTWYRTYTTDVEWLKQQFRMFALEILPDISMWEDCTERVLAAIEKSRNGE